MEEKETFRKLATIQKIDSLTPIPNADLLELAKVKGWNIVVKKGEFKAGDPCVYCEIDSVLPPREPFLFLQTKHFRIRSIKLRGCISQGICFPLTREVLGTPALDCESFVYNIGDDVTETMGVIKYEPNIPANLSGKVKGNFPSFAIKSDEERIQNFPEYLEKYKDVPFYATQKIDGSSITIHLVDDKFGVSSRNLELYETEGNAYWKAARELNIEEKLRAHGQDIVLQGELYGNGVQKNKEALRNTTIAFFNAYDPKTGRHYDYQEFVDVIEKLGLKTVPVVATDFYLLPTVEEMLAFSEGKSLINPNSEREGLVFRPMVTMRDDLTGHRLSFKVISNKYLLKNKD